MLFEVSKDQPVYLSRSIILELSLKTLIWKSFKSRMIKYFLYTPILNLPEVLKEWILNVWIKLFICATIKEDKNIHSICGTVIQ